MPQEMRRHRFVQQGAGGGAETCSFTVRGPSLRSRQQVRLIRPQMALIESVRRRAKVLRESLDCLEVVLNRGLGVVASLEFLQHGLSEMGHRHLLVTHTLPG